MQELIKIEEREGKSVVSARDLHGFLESKQEFANWIKGRIEKYGFVEQEDFLIILSKTTNGRPSKEYALTLDTAKELAMVEANEKGQQARRYFIACEKKLKDVQATPKLKTHTAIEYVQASKDLPSIQNPMLRSLLEQRLMEEVSTLNVPLQLGGERMVILTQYAKELGYTDKQIGTGSALGAHVARMVASEGKQQHGRYLVNTYRTTPALTSAVHSFFA
jgi:anti-repressor protein